MTEPPTPAPDATNNAQVVVDVEPLREAWRGLWLDHPAPPPGRLGRDPAVLCEALLTAWHAPQRHYHDLRHLRFGLRALQSAQVAIANIAPPSWRAAALAWWFHDAIYAPRARDNEQKCATWAQRALSRLGEPVALIDLVDTLIMATTHGSDEPPGGLGDEALSLSQVFVDIDLAILAAPEERYQRYAEDIRREYAHLSDDVYRAGRTRVLRAFLARPRIFATALYRPKEEAARTNITAELRLLVP